MRNRSSWGLVSSWDWEWLADREKPAGVEWTEQLQPPTPSAQVSIFPRGRGFVYSTFKWKWAQTEARFRRYKRLSGAHNRIWHDQVAEYVVWRLPSSAGRWRGLGVLRRAARLSVPPLAGGPADRRYGSGERRRQHDGPGRTVRGLSLPPGRAGDAVQGQVETTEGEVKTVPSTQRCTNDPHVIVFIQIFN